MDSTIRIECEVQASWITNKYATLRKIKILLDIFGTWLLFFVTILLKCLYYVLRKTVKCAWDYFWRVKYVVVLDASPQISSTPISEDVSSESENAPPPADFHPVGDWSDNEPELEHQVTQKPVSSEVIELIKEVIGNVTDRVVRISCDTSHQVEDFFEEWFDLDQETSFVQKDTELQISSDQSDTCVHSRSFSDEKTALDIAELLPVGSWSDDEPELEHQVTQKPVSSEVIESIKEIIGKMTDRVVEISCETSHQVEDFFEEWFVLDQETSSVQKGTQLQRSSDKSYMCVNSRSTSDVETALDMDTEIKNSSGSDIETSPLKTDSELQDSLDKSDTCVHSSSKSDLETVLDKDTDIQSSSGSDLETSPIKKDTGLKVSLDKSDTFVHSSSNSDQKTALDTGIQSSSDSDKKTGPVKNDTELKISLDKSDTCVHGSSTSDLETALHKETGMQSSSDSDLETSPVKKDTGLQVSLDKSNAFVPSSSNSDLETALYTGMQSRSDADSKTRLVTNDDTELKVNLDKSDTGSHSSSTSDLETAFDKETGMGSCSDSGIETGPVKKGTELLVSLDKSKTSCMDSSSDVEDGGDKKGCIATNIECTSNERKSIGNESAEMVKLSEESEKSDKSDLLESRFEKVTELQSNLGRVDTCVYSSSNSDLETASDKRDIDMESGSDSDLEAALMKNNAELQVLHDMSTYVCSTSTLDLMEKALDWRDAFDSSDMSESDKENIPDVEDVKGSNIKDSGSDIIIETVIKSISKEKEPIDKGSVDTVKPLKECEKPADDILSTRIDKQLNAPVSNGNEIKFVPCKHDTEGSFLKDTSVNETNSKTSSSDEIYCSYKSDLDELNSFVGSEGEEEEFVGFHQLDPSVSRSLMDIFRTNGTSPTDPREGRYIMFSDIPSSPEVRYPNCCRLCEEVLKSWPDSEDIPSMSTESERKASDPRIQNIILNLNTAASDHKQKSSRSPHDSTLTLTLTLEESSVNAEATKTGLKITRLSNSKYRLSIDDNEETFDETGVVSSQTRRLDSNTLDEERDSSVKMEETHESEPMKSTERTLSKSSHVSPETQPRDSISIDEGRSAALKQLQLLKAVMAKKKAKEPENNEKAFVQTLSSQTSNKDKYCFVDHDFVQKNESELSEIVDKEPVIPVKAGAVPSITLSSTLLKEVESPGSPTQVRKLEPDKEKAARMGNILDDAKEVTSNTVPNTSIRVVEIDLVPSPVEKMQPKNEELFKIVEKEPESLGEPKAAVPQEVPGELKKEIEISIDTNLVHKLKAEKEVVSKMVEKELKIHGKDKEDVCQPVHRNSETELEICTVSSPVQKLEPEKEEMSKLVQKKPEILDETKVEEPQTVLSVSKEEAERSMVPSVVPKSEPKSEEVSKVVEKKSNILVEDKAVVPQAVPITLWKDIDISVVPSQLHELEPENEDAEIVEKKIEITKSVVPQTAFSISKEETESSVVPRLVQKLEQGRKEASKIDEKEAEILDKYKTMLSQRLPSTSTNDVEISLVPSPVEKLKLEIEELPKTVENKTEILDEAKAVVPKSDFSMSKKEIESSLVPSLVQKSEPEKDELSEIVEKKSNIHDEAKVGAPQTVLSISKKEVKSSVAPCFVPDFEREKKELSKLVQPKPEMPQTVQTALKTEIETSMAPNVAHELDMEKAVSKMVEKEPKIHDEAKEVVFQTVHRSSEEELEISVVPSTVQKSEPEKDELSEIVEKKSNILDEAKVGAPQAVLSISKKEVESSAVPRLVPDFEREKKELSKLVQTKPEMPQTVQTTLKKEIETSVVPSVEQQLEKEKAVFKMVEDEPKIHDETKEVVFQTVPRSSEEELEISMVQSPVQKLEPLKEDVFKIMAQKSKIIDEATKMSLQPDPINELPADLVLAQKLEPKRENAFTMVENVFDEGKASSSQIAPRTSKKYDLNSETRDLLERLKYEKKMRSKSFGTEDEIVHEAGTSLSKTVPSTSKKEFENSVVLNLEKQIEPSKEEESAKKNAEVLDKAKDVTFHPKTSTPIEVKKRYSDPNMLHKWEPEKKVKSKMVEDEGEIFEDYRKPSRKSEDSTEVEDQDRAKAMKLYKDMLASSTEDDESEDEEDLTAYSIRTSGFFLETTEFDDVSLENPEETQLVAGPVKNYNETFTHMLADFMEDNSADPMLDSHEQENCKTCKFWKEVRDFFCCVPRKKRRSDDHL